MFRILILILSVIATFGLHIAMVVSLYRKRIEDAGPLFHYDRIIFGIPFMLALLCNFIAFYYCFRPASQGLRRVLVSFGMALGSAVVSLWFSMTIAVNLYGS